jgi:hypothetical protein
MITGLFWLETRWRRQSSACAANSVRVSIGQAWSGKTAKGAFSMCCLSSLRRGHANLLCIIPTLMDDLRRDSEPLGAGGVFKLSAHAAGSNCGRRFSCNENSQRRFQLSGGRRARRGEPSRPALGPTRPCAARREPPLLVVGKRRTIMAWLASS